MDTTLQFGLGFILGYFIPLAGALLVICAVLAVVFDGEPDHYDPVWHDDVS